MFYIKVAVFCVTHVHHIYLIRVFRLLFYTSPAFFLKANLFKSRQFFIWKKIDSYCRSTEFQILSSLEKILLASLHFHFTKRKGLCVLWSAIEGSRSVVNLSLRGKFVRSRFSVEKFKCTALFENLFYKYLVSEL